MVVDSSVSVTTSASVSVAVHTSPLHSLQITYLVQLQSPEGRIVRVTVEHASGRTDKDGDGVGTGVGTGVVTGYG